MQGLDLNLDRDRDRDLYVELYLFVAENSDASKWGILCNTRQNGKKKWKGVVAVGGAVELWGGRLHCICMGCLYALSSNPPNSTHSLTFCSFLFLSLCCCCLCKRMGHVSRNCNDSNSCTEIYDPVFYFQLSHYCSVQWSLNGAQRCYIMSNWPNIYVI